MLYHNYNICIFQSMDVIKTRPRLFYDVAPRAPLSRILEITSGHSTAKGRLWSKGRTGGKSLAIEHTCLMLEGAEHNNTTINS